VQSLKIKLLEFIFVLLTLAEKVTWQLWLSSTQFWIARGRGLNPIFFQPSPNTLSNYVLWAQLVYMHTIYVTILVGLRQSKSLISQ